MILGLGIPELAIILVILLVLFGPKNLPKLGSSLGKTIRNVREGIDEGTKEATKSTDAIEAPKSEVTAASVEATAKKDEQQPTA